MTKSREEDLEAIIEELESEVDDLKATVDDLASKNQTLLQVLDEIQEKARKHL